MTVDRPVFIIGTGRSGTTLMMQVLARHPQLAWFSNWTNRFPACSQLSALSRLLDHERIHRVLPREWSWVPKPAEAYKMLRHLTGEAFGAHRELEPSDVTPEVARRFRAVVSRHLRWQGKPRFLHKHTGFPRTRYLSEIFPDARFIHVLRDGRAVANSLIHVGFWDGTLDSWWWGPMDPRYQRDYRESNESPTMLAAIVWKTLVAKLQAAMDELPAERGLTVRYDEFISRPHETLERICGFCDLTLSATFLDRVNTIRLSDADDKWRRLPEPDRRMLCGAVEPFMEQIGLL